MAVSHHFKQSTLLYWKKWPSFRFAIAQAVIKIIYLFLHLKIDKTTKFLFTHLGVCGCELHLWRDTHPSDSPQPSSSPESCQESQMLSYRWIDTFMCCSDWIILALKMIFTKHQKKKI